MRDLRRAAVAVLLAAAALPALATVGGGYSTPVRATSDRCTSARMEAGSDGVSRGFAECQSSTGGVTYLGFVSGQGTSWTTTKATAFGGWLLETADDGVATYAVVAASQPESGLHLVTRTRGGRVTTQRLTSYSGVWKYGASVVARGGRWWAVWGEPDEHNPHTVRLYQARTLNGTQARTQIVTDRFNTSPSLALRPGSGVLLAWRKETTTSTGDLWFGESSGGAWTMRVQVPKATMPTLASSGSRVMLVYTTWLGGCAPCDLTYIESRNGTTFGSPHTFGEPFRGLQEAPRPRIAASDGRTFVAFTTPAGDRYSVVVAERGSGGWTETKVATGWRALGDVTAAAGRVTLFIQQTDQGPAGHDLASTRVFAAPPKPSVTATPAAPPKPALTPSAAPTTIAPMPPAATSAASTPTSSASTFTATPSGSSTGLGAPALALIGGAVLSAGAAAALVVRRRARRA